MVATEHASTCHRRARGRSGAQAAALETAQDATTTARERTHGSGCEKVLPAHRRQDASFARIGIQGFSRLPAGRVRISSIRAAPVACSSHG